MYVEKQATCQQATCPANVMDKTTNIIQNMQSLVRFAVEDAKQQRAVYSCLEFGHNAGIVCSKPKIQDISSSFGVSKICIQKVELDILAIIKAMTR